MKVGIITFHNGSNYGAALQAYALQETLMKLYDDVRIIHYKNPFLMKGLNKIRFGCSIKSIYFTITDLLAYKANASKIESFKSFFETYYHLTALYTKEDLLEKKFDCDLCVSGSDQIWNPLLNNGLDQIYFGQIPGVRYRISYASSIGAYDFSNHIWNKEFIDYIKDFCKISVREKADLISLNTNKSIEMVVDPTLLLTKEEWKEKLDIRKTKEKYVLIYAMHEWNYAITLAEKIQGSNLEIWFIGNILRHRKGIKYIQNIGPREFIEIFYNASYIITNSFHGTAFAINFQKPFISIYNNRSPERALALLKLVGLEKCLIYSSDSNNIIIDKEIDYTQVEYCLNKERKKSIEFLMLNIKDDTNEEVM